jgi:hypothetical protein
VVDSVQVMFDLTRFTGRLAQFIATTGLRADEAVLGVATEVLAFTIRGWPVDEGISRAAWFGPVKVGAAAYQIGNPIHYARIIEYGGYRGVGPKTAAFGGTALPGGLTINAGIYPTQRPEAPLRRALAAAYGRMGTAIGAHLHATWGR